jgi:DNA-binding transcriptional LysR family regulator
MTIISQTADLEILLSVFDSGSFTAAANQLNVPVAKVTRAVQRLEASLQVSLFNRTTRRVEATTEGQRFMQQVRPVLQQLLMAEEQLTQDQQTPSGLLRVDAASPFILHQLVPLMAKFRALYPRIRLELVSGENFIDLIEKRTDVAIRIGALQDSNLHATMLGKSKLRLLASAEYLHTFGVPQRPEQLSQHQLLGFSDHSRLNVWPLQVPLTITPDMAASSGETLLQLCLQHQGIALLSDFMTAPQRQSGALVEVLPGQLQSPHPRENVQAVYYRNTALAGRISAFIRFLQQQLQLD